MTSTYCPKSVGEAWDHHCKSAFIEKNMEELKLGYSDDCIITCYNVFNGETTRFHGKQGGVAL